MAIHPALVRFEEHLGRDVRCSNDKTAGLIQNRARALKYSYVGLNQRLAFYLAFDIDRQGGGLAWESADLPPPTLSIVNPVNAHAHLLYELAVPVCVTLAGRAAPLRYAAAVEGAYSRRLGSDPGFVGLMVKNPLSPGWRVVAVDRKYELGELVEFIEPEELNARRPRRGTIGLGRNCDMFDALRRWAYRNVGRAGSAEAWATQVLVRAGALNTFERPLGRSELSGIACSISKWTWQYRDRLGGGSFPLAEVRRRQRQSGPISALRRSSRFGDMLEADRLARAAGFKTGDPEPVADLSEIEAELFAAAAKWRIGI